MLIELKNTFDEDTSGELWVDGQYVTTCHNLETTEGKQEMLEHLALHIQKTHTEKNTQ